jgi:hypothetical protein
VTRALIILLLLAGCAKHGTNQPTNYAKDGTIAVCWSKDLRKGLQSWRDDIERRIGPAIILEAHGEYNIDDVWCRFGDDGSVVPWETIVKLVRDLHPDQPIVVLSCNQRGHTLRTARVWYPRAITWSYPNVSPFWHRGVTTFQQFAYSGDAE